MENTTKNRWNTVGILVRRKEDELCQNITKFSGRTIFCKDEGECVDIAININENRSNAYECWEKNGYILIKHGKKIYYPTKTYMTLGLSLLDSTVITGEFDLSGLPDRPAKLVVLYGLEGECGCSYSRTIRVVPKDKMEYPATKSVIVTDEKHVKLKGIDSRSVEFLSIEWKGEMESSSWKMKNFLEVYMQVFDNQGKLYFADCKPVGYTDEGVAEVGFCTRCRTWTGDYTIQLNFMDKQLGKLRITTDGCVVGVPKFIKPGERDCCLEGLEEMVGLTDIKEDIRRHINFVKMMKAREDMGFKGMKRLMNVVMTGAPGTGKTTVARELANILHRIGVLSSGQLVECNRESMTDEWLGGTEKRTKELIDKAKGGLLFIDEAYSLFSPENDGKDCGQKVLDTLMPILSDPNADLMVVMAGYPEEMEQLLQMNPGLASRFPLRMDFQDYSASEIMEITIRYCEKYGYKLSSQAKDKISDICAWATGFKNYGNGRFVHILMENFIIPNMGTRLREAIENKTYSSNLLSEIQSEDVPEKELLEELVQTKEEKGRKRIGFCSS